MSFRGKYTNEFVLMQNNFLSLMKKDHFYRLLVPVPESGLSQKQERDYLSGPA